MIYSTNVKNSFLTFKKISFRTLFTNARVSCKDPFKIFNRWFVEARDVCDPRDMILTAVLRNGSFFLLPLRCQSYSERGFKFYLLEEPNSRRNDNAALTFIWPSKRMVRIEGITKRLPKHEAEQFFFNKVPYEEQINMVCFTDSQIVGNKTSLKEKIDVLKKKYSQGEVPMPYTFCGQMLIPSSIEFYENTGGTFQNRLKFIKCDDKQEADNILLHKGENGWNYQILSP